MSYPKNALILENVKDMLVILVASEEKFEAIPGEVKQLGNMPSKAGTWNEIEVVFQLWPLDDDPPGAPYYDDDYEAEMDLGGEEE